MAKRKLTVPKEFETTRTYPMTKALVRQIERLHRALGVPKQVVIEHAIEELYAVHAAKMNAHEAIDLGACREAKEGASDRPLRCPHCEGELQVLVTVAKSSCGNRKS